MMAFTKSLIAAAALAGMTASAVFAASHADPAVAAAVKARQAQMQIYVYNLGVLGGMAKGTTPYDAGTASIAAANLAKAATLNQMLLWPEGSEAGMAEGSRALPALWQNTPDVMEKSQALIDAAAEMESAAGMDLASLQGAIGPVGGACGACHKVYRQPE